MSDNLWDAAGYLDDKIAKLRAENADLKAEVERLDNLCNKLMAQYSDISCENINLRKRAEINPAQSPHDIERLKDRVEALRESGDGLWYCLRHIKMVSPADRQEYIDDWVDTRDNIK